MANEFPWQFCCLTNGDILWFMLIEKKSQADSNEKKNNCIYYFKYIKKTYKIFLNTVGDKTTYTYLFLTNMTSLKICVDVNRFTQRRIWIKICMWTFMPDTSKLQAFRNYCSISTLGRVLNVNFHIDRNTGHW